MTDIDKSIKKCQLYYASFNPYGVAIHSNRLIETIRMNCHTIGLDKIFRHSDVKCFIVSPLTAAQYCNIILIMENEVD